MFKDIRRAFTLGGRGAWVWNDARFLAADIEVDARAANRWLPFGLCATKPGRATFFIADYPRTSFGSVYREAAVLLHVRLGLWRGLFCPWMVVDDDTALILGRELLGFPKKMAGFTFSATDSEVSASVERRGVKVLEFSGKIGPEEAKPAPMMARRIFNVWGATGPAALGIQAVVTMKPSERITVSRRVELASARIRGSAEDPLDELKPGSAVSARFVRMDFARMTDLALPLYPVGPGFLLRNLPLRVL